MANLFPIQIPFPIFFFKMWGYVRNQNHEIIVLHYDLRGRFLHKLLHLLAIFVFLQALFLCSFYTHVKLNGSILKR